MILIFNANLAKTIHVLFICVLNAQKNSERYECIVPIANFGISLGLIWFYIINFAFMLELK